MKRINLLSHLAMHERIETRRRIPLPLVLFTVSIAMLIWFCWASVRARDLDAEIVTAQRDLHPLRERHQVIEQLRLVRNSLRKEATTIAAMRDPVPPGSILALLSQVAPKEVALRELSLELPLGVHAGTVENRKVEKQVTVPPSMVIRLEGIAIADTVIAQFVSTLTQTGVFRNVRVDDSRAVSFLDSKCQQFRLSMDVQLVAPETAPGVPKS